MNNPLYIETANFAVLDSAIECRIDHHLSFLSLDCHNQELMFRVRSDFLNRTAQRTYEAAETALYHNLEALAKPEFPHRFW